MARQDRYQSRRETPSFSSSLLDAIYRSIDESNGEEELIFRRDKRKTKHSSSSFRLGQVNNSVQRACMIQKWTQKKQVSGGGCEIKAFGMDPMLLNSSSTSSDSSIGDWFLSSESDSFYSAKARSSSSHCHRPKHENYNHGGVSTHKEPKHHEISNGSIRTKSKAMKIYSDLKTFKQPISPGGKLASFINSLFTSPKKTKNPNKSMSEQPTPTCSSSASSRSCLSTTKTTPSKGNVGTGTKRSVRFCPVSVILDGDSRPRGELKIRHENELQASITKSVINKEIEYRVIEENRRVAEAARELLNSYRKQKHQEFDIDDDDYDDDAASYASSDLFELDNLSAIGNERYLAELPVYETTQFDNRHF